MRPTKFGGKGKQKTVATLQQDLGYDSDDEEFITTVGLQGNHSFHAGSSSSNTSYDYDKIRTGLFHIKVVAKHTKVETFF